MLIIGSGVFVGLATGTWLLNVTIQLVPSLQLDRWLIIAIQSAFVTLWVVRANGWNIKPL